MHFNEISGVVVSAMKIHSELGPGCWRACTLLVLSTNLKSVAFEPQTQLPLPVICDGERMDLGFRIDLLVENTVVVEIKASMPLIRFTWRR